MFADRRDAGQQLAVALEKFRAAKPVVYALPRGGVLVGAEIARVLACDLDVLLVKKLRTPENPELALGAVSEDGQMQVNQEVVEMSGIDSAHLEAECHQRLGEMATQHKLYRKIRPRIPATRRVAILVDDGLATGATMIAAAQTTALARPRRLIVAVPVSPSDTIGTIRAMKGVDETVCLLTPAWFGGVGQFYEDFTQVSDEEVVQMLEGFA